MVKLKRRTRKHVTEQTPPLERRLKRISPVALTLVSVLTLVLGYVAGSYNSQIMAAIGPVFGYKAHSASIDLSSLQQTYNNLAANFDGKLDTAALISGANHGLVAAAGDTYTLYMDKAEASTFNNDLSGNIGGGIGAEIGLVKNKPTVIRVLPGNPAEKSGLAAGDIITGVNDQSTNQWTVEQAVAQIRGDVGTTVKISVQRGTELKDFTITRATVNNPSVTSSVKDEIGTLTVSRFDDQTSDLARVAAVNFKKQHVKAVILDLRGNGGGYLTAAQDMAGLWLNNQVVVTERSGGRVVDTLKSDSNAILAGLPTVVLVNANSASASEIVAGALQDHGAAKLVGEKTFGKGSVQKLLTLNGGAELKVTVAKWYTPNGKNINQQGITPDIKASLTQADIDAGTDPQVVAALKALGQ